jgi:leader peptidase (prepilin peptidase)/N-methyltransferase
VVLLHRIGEIQRPGWAMFLALLAADLALAAWASLEVPHNFLLPVTCVLGWTLVLLAVVDARVFRLPDYLTLPLIAGGLGVAWLVPHADIWLHVIGAAAGFVVFALVALGYRALRGREGMGLGDAKLAAAAGAWLGWEALPSLIIVAAVIGIVWILVRALILGRASLEQRIAFGVPLCAAFWLAWLYGPLVPFAP